MASKARIALDAPPTDAGMKRHGQTVRRAAAPTADPNGARHRLTVLLPPGLIRQVRIAAATDDLELSEVVQQALEAHFGGR